MDLLEDWLFKHGYTATVKWATMPQTLILFTVWKKVIYDGFPHHKGPLLKDIYTS